MFKDILLKLPSTQGKPSLGTVRKALDLARLFEAHVTGCVVEPRVPLPVSFHPFSTELTHQIEVRQREAHEAALAEVARFEEEAGRAGVPFEGRIRSAAEGTDVGEPLVEEARLRDLTIVPLVKEDKSWASLVQGLVFDSGRPVLLLPEAGGETFALERVAIGWDGGRAATRAIGDALPLLQRAGEVTIVTVNHDKHVPEHATGAQLAEHLSRHGVTATVRNVERKGGSVGEAIDAAASGADLVVMGAFGHSRLRDFLLGGATQYMLKNPARPTLLSH
ncbi:universal stress protein [Mesorhizobium sp. CAU 1741]|uniref:universal stress protein n=1 Tax=Mesorhizobium sp. CAU 1741 TaxID=3140366 RepID=UPI00325C11B4